MDDKTFIQDFELIHPVPLHLTPSVHALFLQTWWAKDRQLSFTEKVLKGSSSSWGLLSRQDESMKGFTRVVSDGIAKATIYDVIIDKSLRGMGIGSYFLSRILSSAVLRNVQHIELYCKPEMIEFYNGLDFAELQPEVKLLRLKK